MLVHMGKAVGMSPPLKFQKKRTHLSSAGHGDAEVRHIHRHRAHLRGCARQGLYITLAVLELTT